jgi:hypothetical protein
MRRKPLIFTADDMFDIPLWSEINSEAGNEEISKIPMNFKKIIFEKTFLLN